MPVSCTQVNSSWLWADSSVFEYKIWAVAACHCLPVCNSREVGLLRDGLRKRLQFVLSLLELHGILAGRALQDVAMAHGLLQRH